jgi:polyphosphate kinase 2 (PPK2 family)
MIDLSDYERGRRYQGHYRHDLCRLQVKLSRILAAHIVHKRRAIVMLEGWDTAGKGGAIQRLTAEWDPRHYEVWPIAAPTAAEKKHDFLWRFRKRLPPPGNISVFDRSWYGRVLVERVEGYASEPEWRASYDEINAFEDVLAQDGITLVKLFFHITQKEQDKRLAARLDDPWRRWKSDPDDYRNRARRLDYLAAMAEMFARTDRPESPWIPIDGNDKKAARIAAMTAIAERLEQGVPMAPPPLDPAILAMAEQAFGYRPAE